MGMEKGCKIIVQYQHKIRIWTCGVYTLQAFLPPALQAAI
jgi:hypothetical protein